MFDALISAVSYLGDPIYWAAVLAAVTLAGLSGLIPGMSSSLLMAISLPFIVFNIPDPVIGLVLLATIAGTNNMLDSIPAVLIGQPSGGTTITFLEGHQLARQGKAAHTMGSIYAVSAIGGIVGALALAVVIPVIRPFILAFSYAEVAAVALFGVAMMSALSRGAMFKGLAGAMVGFLLATIGTAPATGTDRFTFGNQILVFGLPIVPMSLGFFALPEMIDLMMSRRPVAASGADVSVRDVLKGVRFGLSRWRIAIRQSTFGVFLGAVPGVGSGVIDELSYALGIMLHKGDKSQFGKGSAEGVLFSESAQCAKEGGQAVPTLALGVPGGSSWVLVLAAMLVYGVAPGPQMLSEYMDLTLLLVFTLALGNLVLAILAVWITGPMARLTVIPYAAIGAVIVPVTFISAFLAELNWTALAIVVGMGVIGMAMKQYGWPRPPFFLAFILGGIIESNLAAAMALYGGITGVLTRPLTLIMTVLAVVTALLFYRITTKAEESVPTPMGGSDVATIEQPIARALRRVQRLRWDWGVLLPLAFTAMSVFAIIEAESFPRLARYFPRWTAFACIGLCSVVILQTITTKETREAHIMDLGRISKGTAGATGTGLIVLGLIALFLLLSYLVGLPWAALAFAAFCPILLLSGPGRLIVSAITVAVTGLFVYLVPIQLMDVIWPTSVLGRMLN